MYRRKKLPHALQQNNHFKKNKPNGHADMPVWLVFSRE